MSLKLGDAGNGDSDAFEFDTETGLLRVREPLNFEQPLDDDEDNEQNNFLDRKIRFIATKWNHLVMDDLAMIRVINQADKQNK